MLTDEETRAFAYHADQDFFASTAVQDMIIALAEKPELTIFVGAGGSVANGLPTWNELTYSMVRQSARYDSRLKTKRQQEAWTRAVLRNGDGLAVASVLRSKFPRASFAEELHKALYPKPNRALLPGRGSHRFAMAIWTLVISRKRRGLKTNIVTLNFDDGLEQTFNVTPGLVSAAEAAGISAVVPVYSLAQFQEVAAQTSVVGVVHLHGFLPQDGWGEKRSSDFILSAADFAQPWDQHWTHSVLEAYSSSHWLMVGMSFQDPHVSFLLRRRSEAGLGGDPPIGILSVQGQAWHEMDAAAAEALAEAERGRLAELNLLVLMTSYFFQDWMFLLEMARYIDDPSVRPYVERRNRWDSMFAVVTARHQPRVQKALLALRTEIERLQSTGATREDLKVEVWLRDHPARSVRLWASSQVKVLDFKRSTPFPLETDSKVAAVRAITEGAPRADRRDDALAAWQSFAAYPLFLTEAPWYDLPVGALVLASTSELRTSMFMRMNPDVAIEVGKAIPTLEDALKPNVLDNVMETGRQWRRNVVESEE